MFEKHAQSKSSNPNNHIFLENGMTLYALVKLLKGVSLGSLGEVIKEKTGCLANMKVSNVWTGDNQNNGVSNAIQETQMYDAIRCQKRKKFKYQPSDSLHDVKGLLATGLLEGIPVKYKKDDLELQGFIADSGISCGCNICDFKQIVSSLMFEKHAQSKSNNQNNHIFLENGTSLYALVKLLRGASLGSLGEVIVEKIGCPVNMKVFNAWTELFNVKDSQNSRVRNTSHETKMHGESQCKKSELHVNMKLACKRLQNEADDGLAKISELHTLDVKRRECRNHTNLLNLIHELPSMFKEHDAHHKIFDILEDGTRLSYHSYGKEILTGYKAEKGIICCCCNNLVSPSQFEAHAGNKKKRKPYHSIYTSIGKPLHELAMIFYKKQNIIDSCSKDQSMVHRHRELAKYTGYLKASLGNNCSQSLIKAFRISILVDT
ncbi:hypothetical protein AXF42_Ash005755 [Apostasia shenzhenica]|uniref:Tify domain-containing protein n=1 Tax=Apostasia shenzhenica TaxID=1088818 RepID=A0A2I0BCA3_9ASPA|nr:hypothetical protein AXF42_Ash005755 [Apostasia shenzhenica]